MEAAWLRVPPRWPVTLKTSLTTWLDNMAPELEPHFDALGRWLFGPEAAPDGQPGQGGGQPGQENHMENQGNRAENIFFNCNYNSAFILGDYSRTQP